MIELRRFKQLLPLKAGSILDLGSYDMHGYNARDVFTAGWQYTGADIAPGPNVDIVIPANAETPLGAFDVVVSLNAIEHVEDPFRFFRFAVSNLKRWGWLFIMAPFSFEYHRHPVDCWRFSPDTFNYLCRQNAIELIESKITKGSSKIMGTLLDIGWRCKRKLFKDAWHVLLRFPNRIHHNDCHMIGRKGSV